MFNSDQSRDLTVGLADVITNVTGSETSLLPSGNIPIFIDSSVAEIYLPDDACSAFETAFHLTYDSNSQLYLVNNTLHAELLAKNPSVTFSINTANTGGPGVNITLPYAAFDLTAQPPLVTTTSPYFPLQRATNNTQYTLGRTFLQEAYLIVDYERYNFSVHPNVWDASATSNIVTIPPITVSGTPVVSLESTPGSAALSTGAIVGIAVGVSVAAIAIIAALLLFIRRRRKLKRERERKLQEEISAGMLPPKTDPEKFNGDPKTVSEEGTEQGTEGTVSGVTEDTAAGDSGPSSNLLGSSADRLELGGNAIHEMPGSPGSPPRAELPTNEMSPMSEGTNESMELKLPPETGLYETPEDLVRVSNEANERRRPSNTI